MFSHKDYCRLDVCPWSMIRDPWSVITHSVDQHHRNIFLKLQIQAAVLNKSNLEQEKNDKKDDVYVIMWNDYSHTNFISRFHWATLFTRFSIPCKNRIGVHIFKVIEQCLKGGKQFPWRETFATMVLYRNRRRANGYAMGWKWQPTCLPSQVTHRRRVSV